MGQQYAAEPQQPDKVKAYKYKLPPSLPSTIPVRVKTLGSIKDNSLWLLTDFITRILLVPFSI